MSGENDYIKIPSDKEARFKEFYEDEIVSLPLDDKVCEMIWNEAWDVQQDKINQLLLDITDLIDEEIAAQYYELKKNRKGDVGVVVYIKCRGCKESMYIDSALVNKETLIECKCRIKTAISSFELARDDMNKISHEKCKEMAREMLCGNVSGMKLVKPIFLGHVKHNNQYHFYKLELVVDRFPELDIF